MCARLQNLKERKEQLLLTLEDTRKEHMLLSDVISKSNTKIMNMTEDVSDTHNTTCTHMQHSIKYTSCHSQRKESACRNHCGARFAGYERRTMNHMQG